MRIINYVGAEGHTIIIEKPTDLFPLLDWIQSEMMEFLDDEDKEHTDEFKEFERCANFISKLMDQAESDGFGSYDDIENVKYS
jgi:hypothetical protein